MKKLSGILLAITLLLSTFSGAFAEDTMYKLGDKMEDFTVTLGDGTEVSLYGMLQEKKAVLINFWASWCNPCKMEMPYMQQAYEEMSDEIGIIALDVELSDTDETIHELWQEMGLTLPVGWDTEMLFRQFSTGSIPMSVLVDRNGVICFMHAGAIVSKKAFLRLFSAFTGDDYSAPVLLTDIPVDEPVAQPTPEALSEALNVNDERIQIGIPEDKTLWPFLPTADGTGAAAANGDVLSTTAAFTATVNVEAGQALAFEYSLSGRSGVSDVIYIDLDGEQLTLRSGNQITDQTDFIPFETAGQHEVTFRFRREAGFDDAPKAVASIANLRIIDTEEVAALEADAPALPMTLEGRAIEVEAMEGVKTALITVTDENGAALSDIDMHVWVMQGDEMILRIKVGKELDPHRVMLRTLDGILMLYDLETDDEGFIYRAKSGASGNLYYLSVFADIFTTDLATFYGEWVLSESDLNDYAAYLEEIILEQGGQIVHVNWAYEDGTPAADTDQAAEPATEGDNGLGVADGNAAYTIKVVDEAGDPVPGAMIQICDDATCAVAVTDENGSATHVAAPYAYEIHLLKAPEGYAKVTETFHMEPAGGELTITLQKE